MPNTNKREVTMLRNIAVIGLLVFGLSAQGSELDNESSVVNSEGVFQGTVVFRVNETTGLVERAELEAELEEGEQLPADVEFEAVGVEQLASTMTELDQASGQSSWLFCFTCRWWSGRTYHYSLYWYNRVAYYPYYYYNVWGYRYAYYHRRYRVLR
jgi:hypothetical protein